MLSFDPFSSYSQKLVQLHKATVIFIQFAYIWNKYMRHIFIQMPEKAAIISHYKLNLTFQIIIYEIKEFYLNDIYITKKSLLFPINFPYFMTLVICSLFPYYGLAYIWLFGGKLISRVTISVKAENWFVPNLQALTFYWQWMYSKELWIII